MRLTKSQLKQIIEEEINLLDKQEPLKEGLEQLTPENMELLFDVIKKMATEPAIATILAGGGLAAAIDMIKDKLKSQAGALVTGTTPTDGTQE